LERETRRRRHGEIQVGGRGGGDSIPKKGRERTAMAKEEVGPHPGEDESSSRPSKKGRVSFQLLKRKSDSYMRGRNTV